MTRITIMGAVLVVTGVITSHATSLTAIIGKVSENCEKIQSFKADVQVRYKI